MSESVRIADRIQIRDTNQNNVMNMSIDGMTILDSEGDEVVNISSNGDMFTIGTITASGGAIIGGGGGGTSNDLIVNSNLTVQNDSTLNNVVALGSIKSVTNLSTDSNLNVAEDIYVYGTSFVHGIEALESSNFFSDVAVDGDIYSNSTIICKREANPRKLVLYQETEGSDHEFYGFGIDSRVLRYQVARSSHSHVFYSGTKSTSSNELMRIEGDGKVGIGTTSPDETLEVNGNIKCSDLYVGESGGESSIFLGGGAAGDQSYFNTVIESRVYASPSYTELLLYKGNDQTGGILGPDRIRLRAAQICFDTYSTNQNQNSIGSRENEDIKMVVNGNGNVGIGETDPSGKLNVIPLGTIGGAGNVQNAGLLVGSTSDGIGIGTNEITKVGGDFYLAATDGNMRFQTNSGSERMTILSGGNVGIGTTSPGHKLDVNGNIHTNARLFVGDTYQLSNPSYTFTTGSGLVQFRVRDDSSGVNNQRFVTFYNYSSIVNKGTIQTGSPDAVDNSLLINPAAGNVGIGTTDPSYKLDVNGNLNYSGSLTNVSDRRIKKNIADINDGEALNMIRQLSPKTYQYIDTKSHTNSTVYGYIAQEVGSIIPNSVKINTNFIPNIYSNVSVSISPVNVTTINTETITNTTVSYSDDSNVTTIMNVTTIQITKLDDVVIDRNVTQSETVNTETYIGVAEGTNTTTNVTTHSDIQYDHANFLIHTNTSIPNVTIGDTIKVFKDTNNNPLDVTVQEITNLSVTLTCPYIDTSLDMDNVTELFFYGKQVDDFYVMNKNAIFTVATAALQELDRQVQNLTVEKTGMQEQITNLTLENQTIRTRLDVIESRLSTLESS